MSTAEPNDTQSDKKRQVNYSFEPGTQELAKILSDLDGMPVNVWVQGLIHNQAVQRRAEIEAELVARREKAIKTGEDLARVLDNLTAE